MFVLILSFSVDAATYYVSPNGSNNPPYDTWENAATNIAAAVGMADNGDVITVSNGIYVLTDRIHISHQITLQSVNGPAVTVIDGNNSNACIYMENRYSGPPLIDGFTITRGNGVIDGMGGYGGGVNMIYSEGTIRNCIVTSNCTDNKGGGIFCYQGGNIENCLITGNQAVQGGGLYITDAANARNCLFLNNSASNEGGAAYTIWGTIDNCTILYNSAADGGGLYSTGTFVRNTIIWSNTAVIGPNYSAYGTHGGYEFCCTDPLITGPGNITNAPVLADLPPVIYQLTASSPCIDAGSNLDWMATASDFDGQPRVFNGIPDIGADEATIESLSISVTDSCSSEWNCVVGATCQLDRASTITASTWKAVSGIVTAQSPNLSFLTTNTGDYAASFRLRWIR